MPNQKKRTAWSVQDVVSGRAASAPSGNGSKYKSGYSGPKKSSSAVMEKYNIDSGRRTGTLPREEVERTLSKRGNYTPTTKRRYSMDDNYDLGRTGQINLVEGGYGIWDYAWIVYSAILGIALLVALIFYSTGSKKQSGYIYPSYVPTMNGVLNAIYDDYAHGGLGSAYNANAANMSAEDGADSISEVEKNNMLGQGGNDSALPNTTTGATMVLDTGSTYGEFGIAGSYEELLTQLSKALEANEFGFVGMKLCYEDEETGNLIGYPPSVVEHFTKYMSDNTGKREIFLDNIKDENTFMVKNGSAYLVKLPILKFSINMGYDNTSLAISGFANIQMDAGQSAVVSPLLPCMYTITVSTGDGSQTSEVECDMDEGDLQVNIGVTN